MDDRFGPRARVYAGGVLKLSVSKPSNPHVTWVGGRSNTDVEAGSRRGEERFLERPPPEQNWRGWEPRAGRGPAPHFPSQVQGSGTTGLKPVPRPTGTVI